MTGHLQAEIAEIVGRDQGTIGRELAKYLMAFKAEGSPLIAELAK